MKRHEAREKALQALYQIDVGKGLAEDAIAHVLEEEAEVTPADRAFVSKLVRGTWQGVEETDVILQKHVSGWNLDRMNKVDLNIIRMAVFELQSETDVDIATVIDEAVILAKSFGAEESGKFVNGVLARVLPFVAAPRG